MSFDAQLKRYFPAIVFAMVGIVVFFAASAIRSFQAAERGVPNVIGSQATASASATPTDPDPILDRNPFDSTAPPIPRPEKSATPRVDDSGASACKTGRVVMIADNDDPNWAFAAIEDGSGKSQLRRVGDRFGDYVLMSLAWDRVYLEEKGKRCFLSMGDGALPTAGAGGAAPSGEVKKISDTEFELDRATLDAVMGGDAQLLSGVRLSPVRRGDRVGALKLGVVAKSSRLSEIGLRTRDELESMNGVALTSPAKLLEAYESMADATRIELRVTRGGVPRTITYRTR